MPSRDRHGKSTEDYRESQITVLDSISPRRRAKRSNPTLWIWLLVPVATLWLNWSQVATYFKTVTAATKRPTLTVQPAPVSMPALPTSALPAAVPERNEYSFSP